MSRSLRRGVLAAAFAFVSIPLTACGAGFDAETQGILPDNASAEVDDIKVQNVNVVLGPDGVGPAAISARLFNDSGEEQTLEAITLGDSGEQMRLVPAVGESRIAIPAHGWVALGGEGNAAAVVDDAAAVAIAPGNAQHLVFDLSDSGGVDLFARVIPAGGHWAHYEDWAPPPALTPIPAVDR